MQLVPCEWGGLPRAAIVVGEITPAGRAFLSLGPVLEHAQALPAAAHPAASSAMQPHSLGA
ncbi:hypothetical protein [Variovorax sp. JS1663]|uniref:hypothetical protein n=1 Tax=Variovorax sp. JS1663 TaxID=1851577 RepID=UPI001863E3B6|nr:hypothetical protein [Variovorax sp. JS1663]